MIFTRTIFLIFLFLFNTIEIDAQYVRQKRDVFPVFGDFKRSGWLIAPGLTYSLGNFVNETKVFDFPSDSAYSIDFNPSGKFGVSIDLGRFYAPQNAGFIQLIDFALSFKLLRGKELFVAKSFGNAQETSGTSVFTQGFVSGTIHFNNLKQLNDRSFILNGIGVNIDYNLIDNMAYNHYGLSFPISQPSTLLAQLNYQLGYGFKAQKNLLIIPTLETPILNVWDFENGKSTLSYFSSRYRPILLKIKFLLIDSKTDIKCPSGKGKKGKTKRSKEDPLWGSRRAPW